MQKDIDSAALISKFIEYATIEGETKLTGDYRTGNKMSKRLTKIYELIKTDMNIAQTVLGTVMRSESYRARSLAAVDALRLNILVEEAVALLEEGAKREDILGFGCETALKIWRGEVPGATLLD
jgi:hypothetical protein